MIAASNQLSDRRHEPSVDRLQRAVRDTTQRLDALDKTLVTARETTAHGIETVSAGAMVLSLEGQRDALRLYSDSCEVMLWLLAGGSAS